MLTVNSLVGFGAKRSSPSSPNYYGTGAEGDYTVSSNTTLDGGGSAEMLVKNYNNLLINNGVQFLLKQRKGSLIYCLGDCTINGTLKAESGYSCDPSAAGVPAGGLVIARRTNGSSSGSSILTGCGSTATTSEANQPSLSSNGTIWTIPRVGGGGGYAQTSSGGAVYSGINGSSGSGSCGGGGSGVAYGRDGFTGTSGTGAAGTCFSGGSGGGSGVAAIISNAVGGNAQPYGGAGGDGSDYSSGYSGVTGGAGNPAGAGQNAPSGNSIVGGLVILIVKGNLTISGSLLATGGNGVGGYAWQSGASGGGIILALYRGTYSNSGTVSASGGTSAGTWDAGDGGTGTLTTAQIL